MADLDKEITEETKEEACAQASDDSTAGDEACETVEAEVEDTEDGEDSEDAGDTEDGSGEDAGDGKKKSRLFGKKEKKKDKKDQQIEDLNDRLIRQMAEFDNFRKRTDKEKSQMFDSGSANIIEKILPVIDDLERGLAALGGDEKEDSFAKGVEMIYKKFIGILTDAGVTAIEAVGQEFDPNFHNAVMQSPSEEYESGYVVQELQKGYMYKEKVIRHSMVIVAE